MLSSRAVLVCQGRLSGGRFQSKQALGSDEVFCEELVTHLSAKAPTARRSESEMAPCSRRASKSGRSKKGR